jgi:hypothetical protein
MKFSNLLQITLFTSLLVTPLLQAAPDLIVINAKVATFDQSKVSAFSVTEGRISAVSNDAKAILASKNEGTVVIDARGQRLVPGINDSHLHAVRAGRFYNLETRWEGVTSLPEALDLIKQQAKRVPKGQWVRVNGGWSPHQFKEKRLPTIAELNAAAPDTPVFVLFLYSGGMLNQAGLKALGIGKETEAPVGSYFERDTSGNPTGVMVADPNPMLLYKTVAALPQLDAAGQYNSSIQFYRKLLSLGVTSVVDAGGGGHQFPDDYQASTRLALQGDLPVRVSAYLFPQKPKVELQQFQSWMEQVEHDHNMAKGEGRQLVIEGGGELLVWSASDYENFKSQRPDLKEGSEAELEKVIRLHQQKGWPFRIHATYDESISRMLNVLEKVNKDQPLSKIRWAFDHAETISDANLKRVKALGGGIAVQGRMAFAGEDFLARYGLEATKQSPPVKKMLAMGIPVGLGTDGTRVASFNPWSAYYWAVSGRTVGGTELYAEDNRLDRLTALQLFTQGSAWFSGEEQVKGQIKVGQYADFTVLNHDILTVPEHELLDTKADLTVVNGRIEFARAAFAKWAIPRPKAVPDWSPVNFEID